MQFRLRQCPSHAREAQAKQCQKPASGRNGRKQPDKSTAGRHKQLRAVSSSVGKHCQASASA
eukprot:9171896-Alexandrium_andersonii.AAC.1